MKNIKRDICIYINYKCNFEIFLKITKGIFGGDLKYIFYANYANVTTYI